MSRMTLPHKIMLSAVALTAAAAMAMPAAARCYRDSNADGAIVGAIAGAAIGNAASGRHDRGSGTAAGAIIGAVAGAAIDDSNDDCRYDEGYRYDNRSYYESYPRPYYRERVYVERPRSYYRERNYRHDRYDDRRHSRDYDRNW
jgi:phage tail tape-measure protein